MCLKYLNIYWVCICGFASFSASKVWGRPQSGLMTRRNTGRSRGSGRPPWCESWMAGTIVHRAGRDGANQEYLNDEIFSQPLFSLGQLSRTSAAASVGSSKANVKCSLLSLLSPHVARCRHRGANNNNQPSHILSCHFGNSRNIIFNFD